MRKFLFFLLLMGSIGFSSPADEISFSSIVPLVLEKDLNVQITSMSYDSSYHGRELLRAGTLPQITVNPAPGYSFTNSRFEDPLNGNEITDLTTHAVSASVNLTQVLPTDGVLTASLSDTITVVERGEDRTINQSPGLSVSLTQPLFTNGKIIDLSIYRARQSLIGDIPVTRASLLEKAARNAGLFKAFTTYKSTFSLRRQLEIQDRNIEMTEKLLNLSRLRERQGSITSRDLWEEELLLESLKEARLELKYALMEAEQNLARSLGISDPLSGINLAPGIPSLEIDESDTTLFERAMTTNPDILDGNLAVEEARHNATLNGRDFSSDLSLSLSLHPKYSPARATDDIDDTFGSSFSDLFDENAYIEPVISVGLSFPVYDGGKAKHQREIDKNTVSIAEGNLASVRRLVADTMGNLFLRRNMLAEKLELVRANLRLEQERLAEKQRLLELKQITALEADRVRLKASEKELEIWITEADLFLNGVQILNQAGYDLQLLFEGSE